MKCDIFFVGVGGQGILTIGEILAEVAYYIDLPVYFYPSKGMAQRGGFVKAQLSLGRENVGPNIPQRGADMVIAMEQSESLKAIPFIKPNSDFVLYGDIWETAAVSLGKNPYPTLEQIMEQVKFAEARLVYIDPRDLPKYAGKLVRANLYILGVIMSKTMLGTMIRTEDVEHVIQTKFEHDAEANIFAYRSGLRMPQGVS